MSGDTKELSLYVVYNNPRDFPGKVVVRRQVARVSNLGPSISPDIAPTAVCETIEEARRHLPYGVTNIGRQDDDDPVIAEVWI